MSRKGYVGGYRGRKTGHDMLIILVVVLAVLAAVLVGVTMLGGGQFIQEKLPSPSENVTQPPEPSQTPEQTGQPEPEKVVQPEPEPEPEPELEVMAAVELSLEEAVSITAVQKMEEAGANSLILNMKPANGPLGWVSSQPMAVEANANSTLTGINDMLKAINDQDYYTVARVSCFRDELLSVNKDYCIRSNSGYRWQDFEKVNWTSPASEAVQDYLVALMVELAELGFDEIVLENCGYPPDGSGEMGWIKRGSAYDPENLHVAVNDFLSKAREALLPYGTQLSVRTNETILMQDGYKTGLTAALVDEWFDRIWLAQPEDGTQPSKVLQAAQIKGIPTRLVKEVAEFGEYSSVPQAILR